MRKIIWVVATLALALALAGCDTDKVGIIPGRNLDGPSGKLVVRISGQPKAKGISPIRMDVDHYSINLISEGRDSINLDGVTSDHATFEVPSGTWDVVVTARNRDGIAIGEGRSSCVVKLHSTTECEILVEEYAGKGNLNLVAEVSGECAATIEVFDAKDNVVVTKDLASGSNIFQLDSGFYMVKIADGSGEILLMETFRIVANHDTNAAISVSSDGDGAIHVARGISNIPDIALSMKPLLSFGEEFTVEAQVENLPDPVYKWYLDNVLIEGEVSSVCSSSIPSNGEISEGTHTITCKATSNDVVWSVSKQFSVLEKTFEGAWWVAPKPDESRKVYLKLDMHGGHMVYDYYDGGLKEASLGQGSEYQIQKSGEDYEISFYDQRYGTFRFVVRGGDLGNVEFNDPWWWKGMTDVTFKPFVSEPEWTEGCAERNCEYHVRTISNPELGTFEIDGDHFRHKFENGICVQCGYDSNKRLYEVNSDFSVVDESVDYLNIRRYWPGMLALGDETVVDGSDGFYIKKRNSSVGWGNYYILYIPHTIVDFYVQNGGGGGERLQKNAFEWYVEQALGRECDFGDCGPYNEMLKELFANGNQIESLDPGTIQKPYKTKVSNDVSLITSNRTGLSYLRPFTFNDVEFEDGSPVTESEAFYFQLAEHDGGVYLFYPESIQQEYEKGQGANPESGDPFWWYLHTYHPEIDAADSHSIETLKQLVSSEFIQPSYLDVGDRYRYKD